MMLEIKGPIDSFPYLSPSAKNNARTVNLLGTLPVVLLAIFDIKSREQSAVLGVKIRTIQKKKIPLDKPEIR